MLAQLQMQAHEQGYTAGLNEGRQKGHDLGYQEGLAKGLEHGIDQARQQQAPIHARMQQLVSEFQHTLDALDSVIASRLMQMALEAARQVIGQTPVVDNTALIKQIQGLCSRSRCSAANRSCAFTRTICSALKRAWGNPQPARLASARRSVVTPRRLQSLCRRR
jgi:flagellar biosynthesis/type III secretory pathway protein FliH